jgi:hypothetical protein
MDMLPTPPGVIRRRRQQVALIGVGVTAVSLMFLCEILIIAGNGGLRSAPTSPMSPITAVAPSTPTRDGTLLLSAGEQTCNMPQVGSDAVPVDAVEQFCVVDITVTNVGHHAAVLSLAAQFGIATNGRRVPVSQVASVYAATGPDYLSTWVQLIQPGDTVTGPIVFDLPIGVSLHRVELHGSPGSPGITVLMSTL